MGPQKKSRSSSRNNIQSWQTLRSVFWWASSPRWSWCFKGHFMLMHRPLKTVRALTRSVIVHLSLTLQAFAPPAPKMCGTMNSARKHVTQDVDKEMAWKLLLYKHLVADDIVQHKFE